MSAATQAPQRLYLLQLAIIEPQGIAVPGYLIQTGDGKNVLIDTGWPKSMIGAYKQGDPTGVRIDEEDYVVNQLAVLGLSPRDIHFLICTHFDPDPSIGPGTPP